jgi:hypothetical protein
MDLFNKFQIRPVFGQTASLGQSLSNSASFAKSGRIFGQMATLIHFLFGEGPKQGKWGTIWSANGSI